MTSDDDVVGVFFVSAKELGGGGGGGAVSGPDVDDLILVSEDSDFSLWPGDQMPGNCNKSKLMLDSQLVVG